MDAHFGPELYLRFFVVLAAVIGVILLLAWGVKRFGFFGQMGRFKKGTRLQVQDSLLLDPKRRLVIVNWDGDEHLLLLGSVQDQVVAVKPKKNKPTEE